MARIPWTFYDPVVDETYSLPVNPNEGGEADLTKNVIRKATTAPGGRTIIMEGNRDPATFSFSGTILSEAQFEAFNEWFEKSRIILITDDLGREWQVYLTQFRSRRRISHQYPWRHEYDAEAVVVR